MFQHTDPLAEQVERRHQIEGGTFQVGGRHDGEDGLAAPGRQRGDAAEQPGAPGGERGVLVRARNQFDGERQVFDGGERAGAVFNLHARLLKCEDGGSVVTGAGAEVSGPAVVPKQPGRLPGQRPALRAGERQRAGFKCENRFFHRRGGRKAPTAPANRNASPAKAIAIHP
ncbi:hypothetical protein SDC9_141573 [bioreactor metagenome]|uniref:Uncharacterized protein n=1 Tax=bioreactor metagenome TaxID=1076179 RepID=A0A645DYH4_9ZZZZ